MTFYFSTLLSRKLLKHVVSVSTAFSYRKLLRGLFDRLNVCLERNTVDQAKREQQFSERAKSILS